ncbi:MAG: hypothetical protein IH608_13580, partial [Proteobacteria bacterium]|nr:hypothetical protein [Pseudomonadota bacterium]
MNDLELYDLEAYLFGSVNPRFHRDGSIGAFDLMCIVSWKANRAKSRVAARLLGLGHPTLEDAARALTSAVSAAPNSEARLRTVVRDWGFRLPTATAILAVLYPDEFTVCDVRVAGVVGARVPEPAADFSKTWAGYLAFRDAVERAAPAHLSLRDKDRFLWARSFREQMEKDITAWNAAGPGDPADELELYVGGFPGASYR